MPKTCCAVGCTNHNLLFKKLSFHKFPKDEARNKLWIQALKRDQEDGKPWIPAKHSVICNAHFIEGKPHSCPSHPDYVPSVFGHTSKKDTEYKLQQKMKRYNNATKRSLLFTSPETKQTCCKKVKTTIETEEQQLTPVKLDENEQLNYAFIETPPRQESTPSFCKERNMFILEIDTLREDKKAVVLENANLKSMINSVRLRANSCEDNDKKTKYYTGLRWDVFMSLFTTLHVFINPTPLTRKLPLLDQFFITLVKLRIDVPFELLADQCGIPSSTLHDMFWRWVYVMSTHLDFFIHWPDRETMEKTLPSVFKSKFNKLTSIIDCFEVFIDRPKHLDARGKCYSNYKKHSTVKVFIVCSPLGSITFLSTVWGGRVSDVELVRASGFIHPDYHHPGDQILADRGFTLHDDFASVCAAELLTPAFTKGRKQLSAEDIEKSRKISSIRIHIERVIGLMKNRYRILHGTLPINCIKTLNDEAADPKTARIDKLIRLCAALTNLGDGIVYSEN